MINKFFLLGIGGVTVASAGAGVGVYYAVNNEDPFKAQKPEKPEAAGSFASSQPALQAQDTVPPRPSGLSVSPGPAGPSKSA